MKESEIQRMSINRIFSELGFALQIADVTMAINLSGDKGKDLVESFKQECPSPYDKNYKRYVEEFLRNNETNVNKTILIMLLLENYLKELKTHQYNIKVDKESIEKIKKWIGRAKKILQGCNKMVCKIVEKKDKTVCIETLTVEDLISEKSSQKNSQKLMELENSGLHLGEILNSLILTDLGDVVCNKELGELIRYQSFFNTAIKKGAKVDETVVVDPQEQIEKLREGLTYKDLLPEVESAIRDNIEYIDFDKLVLCSAYRYIEYVDEITTIKEEEKEIVFRRLKGLLEYLEDKNTKIEGRAEKPQFYGYKKECEYEKISYRVKDLKQDMKKIEGTIYWGKAKIEEVRQSLLLGETALRDTNIQRIKLTKEDLKVLAKACDDNYLYLIENNLIDAESVAQINAAKPEISSTCLTILVEYGYLEGKKILELYLQGKVDLENITQLDIDFREALNIEDIFYEYQKEDNDERKDRIIDLYKKISLEEDTQKEENKQKVYDAYLEQMDARYLELFLNIGTLDFDDLEGIMSGQEWIEVFRKGEISEEFFSQLQERKIITEEDIKGNKNILNIELKLWEDGKLSSQEFKKLGITIEELLNMCEEGKIKGVRIGELIPKEDLSKYERNIISNYTYGMYGTIRPALAAYNSNIINRDKTIEIIKEMKISSTELASLCEEGLLDGTKIAEFRYKGVLTKGQFRKLKEQGLVSDKQEVEVANNLTPQEMLRELEANGCTKIENIEEILAQLSFKRKQTERGEGKGRNYNKRVLNPVKRNQILEILGTDTIVTTPENGFNGYQAFLIPKLGVAVLEKMFRKNKKEELQPSYGDATYICEIGKYIQVSGQSKSEIRAFMNVEGSTNGNVDVINHTHQWGEKLIKAIQKVNPDIIIEKNKDEITSISKGENQLNIDIKELNNIIGLMKQGEFSISMEEYE